MTGGYLGPIKRKSDTAGNIVSILAVAVLFLAILANSMTKPLGRDENMYCTGGVLLAEGKMIWRDFSYVAQMPYHALLCAVVFRLSNTTHYLLAGRLISVVCDIGVVLCIFAVYLRVFGPFSLAGKLLGIASAVLYVFNPIVDYANGHAWNNDVVILSVMLSLYLVASADFRRGPGRLRSAAVGVLLTLGTCMRITTALVELLFFIFLILAPADSSKDRLKRLGCFLIGTAVILVWPTWLMLEAPKAVSLNLFHIQMLNSKWLHQIGLVHDKGELFLRCLGTPPYLVLVLLSVCLFVGVIWLRSRLEMWYVRTLLLMVLVTLAFFMIALILPATWPQHLAFPVPFLAMSLAYPLIWLKKLADSGARQPFRISTVLVSLSAIVAVISYPLVLFRIPGVFEYHMWEPVRLHRIAQDIAEQADQPKLVLTLAPLYALEGGCDIYTELSAGAFTFRIGHLMSPEEQTATHTVSPETLRLLLESSPPSTVVVGVEAESVEEPLLRTAIGPDSQKWERKTYETGPTAYFKR
jgi:hypothetical protein